MTDRVEEMDLNNFVVSSPESLANLNMSKHLLKSPQSFRLVFFHMEAHEAYHLMWGLINGWRANEDEEVDWCTLCVWRSKLDIYRGNLKGSEDLITQADNIFNELGYLNKTDKVAVNDIKALIYAKDGNFEKEIECLIDANKVFLESFSKYHYASIERSLKLAIAYKNNGQVSNAKKVLQDCLAIVTDMQKEIDTPANDILTKEILTLLAEMQ